MTALAALTSTTGNKTDCWNTPSSFVEDVIAFYDGDITTDPCCNDVNNPNVPARRLFDESTNGLTQRWEGNVFMNHPYSASKHWIPYAVSQYEMGIADEMILLIKLDVSTKWWQSVSQYPWIAVNRRLRFGDGRGAAPFQSAIIYLGTRLDRFADVFGHYGTLYAPVTPVKLAQLPLN